MIQLLLIRHGATAGNLQKRYIGQTDQPLCDVGIAQIEALKKYHFEIDDLFVSPMLRTRQTAELLFPQVSYTMVPEFQETNFGLFEGKTAEELSNCPEYQAWIDSGCLSPIPGGEPVSAFKARCCAAFEKIMQTIADGRCVAFVIHGGVIMSILERYAQPQKNFYDYHIGNGAYLQCQYRKVEPYGTDPNQLIRRIEIKDSPLH